LIIEIIYYKMPVITTRKGAAVALLRGKAHLILKKAFGY
jgi:hypothetical protein